MPLQECVLSKTPKTPDNEENTRNERALFA